jgi:Protein of unknown function (DUF1488)
MRLRLIAGTLEVQAHGVAFSAHFGTRTIACGVTRDVLLDLACDRGLHGTEEALFQALYPEIERLAILKYNARRIGTSGEVLVGAADLMLHGFQESGRSVA